MLRGCLNHSISAQPPTHMFQRNQLGLGNVARVIRNGRTFFGSDYITVPNQIQFDIYDFGTVGCGYPADSRGTGTSMRQLSQRTTSSNVLHTPSIKLFRLSSKLVLSNLIPIEVHSFMNHTLHVLEHFQTHFHYRDNGSSNEEGSSNLSSSVLPLLPEFSLSSSLVEFSNLVVSEVEVSDGEVSLESFLGPRCRQDDGPGVISRAKSGDSLLGLGPCQEHLLRLDAILLGDLVDWLVDRSARCTCERIQGRVGLGDNVLLGVEFQQRFRPPDNVGV